MTTKKYFGTDGVRGRVGGDVMRPAFIKKLGWAIGIVLKENTVKNPTVFLGRDTRESGEILQQDLQEGLLSAGVDVNVLGVISTPAVAYFTQQFSADAGIIVSASHNLYQDNGIKIIGQKGSKLSDAWELMVEEKINSPSDKTEKNIT